MDRRELVGRPRRDRRGARRSDGRLGPSPRTRHAHKDGDIHEKCADACSDCAKECNQGFHHCFKQVQAGKAGHAKAMHLCVDCGEVCSTSAKLVARMSPLMTITCHACAESCEACIAECEKLNDPGMKETVESLKKCAASCREMVKAMGGHKAAG